MKIKQLLEKQMFIYETLQQLLKKSAPYVNAGLVSLQNGFPNTF